MLIVTSNDIPGYRVDAVLGEVMGMTVRAANLGANIVAGFRAIGGGEVNEYTQLVYDSRNQVMQRMWEQAVQRGANAIVAMRFDTGDIGQSFSEVCAYGTAVVVTPLAEGAPGATPQSAAQAAGQVAPQSAPATLPGQPMPAAPAPMQPTPQPGYGPGPSQSFTPQPPGQPYPG